MEGETILLEKVQVRGGMVYWLYWEGGKRGDVDFLPLKNVSINKMRKGLISGLGRELGQRGCWVGFVIWFGLDLVWFCK